MKKNVILIIATAFLASCIGHENMYDSERVKENAKANFPVKNIDPNQDWATRGARTLDVTVNDKQGQVYTIKVFTANPFQSEENPRLLTQSEVENGVKLSLKFDASLALDYIYVMCKAGEKDYVVQAVPLVGDKFTTFFGKDLKTRAAIADLPGGIEVDRSLTELPADANEDCVIDVGFGQGMSFVGAVPGNYHLKDVTLDTGIPVGDGQHIYISGKVTVPSIELRSLGSSVSILPGATLIIDESKGMGITIASNAIFYNAGTFNNPEASTMISSLGKFLNEGTYKGGYFYVQNDAVAQNNCVLDVREVKLNQGTINNGGLIKCTSLDLWGNAKLNLSGKSVLSVSGGANLGAGTITASATGTKPYPFFNAGSFSIFNNGSTTVNNNIYTNAGGESSLISKFKVIKATVGALSEGECVPPVNVEGDNTENTPASGCTIGFEDVNAAVSTDYDFNDVVLWVSNPVNDVAHVYLVAAGATNRIKVGYETSNGRAQYFFDGREVHNVLNISEKTMFNTSGELITKNIPVDELQVSAPMLEKINFFIEVNEDTNNRIYSKNSKEYIGGVPFGLCVSEDWNFPVERKRIDEAYLDFGSWGANKETNKTWYKNGKSDLIRPFNSALLNK